jgi:hypothetical protein
MIRNKHIKLTFAGVSLVILALSSCLKEKEGGTAVVTNPTYEADVKKILDARGCEGCHSSQAPIITDYNGVKDNFTAVIGSIRHLPSFSNMPKGGAKLPDEEIRILEDWKTQGFKEK